MWDLLGLLKPRVLGNKLTQKDNADSGVQFITPAGPRQSLLLAKDPDQHLWKSFIPHVYVSQPTTQIPWDLHNLRKGKYNPNNPITHVPCAQTVKQLASKHEVTLRQVQKSLWPVWRKGWLVYVFS